VLENSLSKWVRDERRRMETIEGTSDEPLSPAERAEWCACAVRWPSRKRISLSWEKLPRTSLPSHQSRAICVDGRGVRELRSQAHGPTLRRQPRRLLPLARSPTPRPLGERTATRGLRRQDLEFHKDSHAPTVNRASPWTYTRTARRPVTTPSRRACEHWACGYQSTHLQGDDHRGPSASYRGLGATTLRTRGLNEL